jgi:hypothetical protein
MPGMRPACGNEFWESKVTNFIQFAFSVTDYSETSLIRNCNNLDRQQDTKTLMGLKEHNIKSAIYNWASSWNEIKTRTHETNSLAMKNWILS